MGGIQDLRTDLSYLQVRGVSKLKKELEEQKDMPKYLDFCGLHRNEETEEIEAYDEWKKTDLANR